MHAFRVSFRCVTNAWRNRRSRSSAAARSCRRAISPRRRSAARSCNFAAIATSPTSAASPRPSATWSSTSTTSTRPFRDRGNGTSSGWRRASCSRRATLGFPKASRAKPRLRRRQHTASARRNMRGSRRSTCGTGRSTLRILPISSSGTPTCRAIWARSKSMPASERPKRSFRNSRPSRTVDRPSWTIRR